MSLLSGLLNDKLCLDAHYNESGNNLLKDNDHLSLVILANGDKQWRLSVPDPRGGFSINYLGSFPDISLSQARQLSQTYLPSHKIATELSQLDSRSLPSSSHTKSIEEATPPTAPTNNLTTKPADLTSTTITAKTSLPIKTKTMAQDSAKKTVLTRTVKHTFSNTVKRWLKLNQERWKESRYLQIEKVALSLLSPELKNYEFRELTEKILISTLEKIATNNGKIAAREALMILKGVLDYALEKHYLTRLPIDATHQHKLSFLDPVKATPALAKKTNAKTTSVKPTLSKLKESGLTGTARNINTSSAKPSRFAHLSTPPVEMTTDPLDTIDESTPQEDGVIDHTPITTENVPTQPINTDTIEASPATTTQVNVETSSPSTIPLSYQSVSHAPPVFEPTTPSLPSHDPSPLTNYAAPQALHVAPQSLQTTLPPEEITLGYLLKKQLKQSLSGIKFKGLLSYVIVAAISSWLAMQLVNQEKEILAMKLDVAETRIKALESANKQYMESEKRLNAALSDLQALSQECQTNLKKALRNAKRD